MPTNPNMVAIQTVTVGAGGASSIEFTSIPQTYTDLVVKLSARSTSANTFENYILTFNGSSQTGMSGRHLYGTGSAAGSGTYSSGDGSIFSVPANVTASTFGNLEMYIPNYTSANNKSISIDNVSENNATAGQQNLQASLWSNSAAITSIRFALSGGNYAQYSTATLYGVTSAAVGAKATGGIISSDANYYYHTFVASGTFTPTSNITADYLVVAGGGGGGGNPSGGYGGAGGGGAGGLRCTVTATGGGGSLESALSLTASTNYTVTVGAGGAGGAGNANGSAGSNSVFSSITSTGGGFGSTQGPNGSTAGTGGSGGGGGHTRAGGAGTTNQGYAGGSAVSGSGGGAGGGGAGATGSNANSGGNLNGANAGNGVATAISGSSVTYAGGGGGGAYNSGTSVGTGGTGGGGNGGLDGVDGSAGTANTGGAGGGAGGSQTGGQAARNGGAGGSGIVIVRYAK